MGGGTGISSVLKAWRVVPDLMAHIGGRLNSARKRHETSWTGPVEWDVLARIRRPLKLEADVRSSAIDRRHGSLRGHQRAHGSGGVFVFGDGHGWLLSMGSAIVSNS